MASRRTFLRTLAGTGILLSAGFIPMPAFAANYTKITLLHTNDVHSRIEPFSSGRTVGLGGAARRSALIKQIRSVEKHVVLLDAGDIFQGTPYFNFFKGELEFKLMNEMGYDAATIGNHDFDAGMEALKKQLVGAKFPMLNANYTLTDTPLEGYTKPYHIIQKGDVKIGILGIGVRLEGLVPPKLFGKATYQDPYKAANKTADILKNKEKCHLVICLSHLGYAYDDEPDAPCDVNLAKQSADIDVIIGGHTHTFMEEPAVYKNAKGIDVLVNQVGWAGIKLGRIDVYLHKTTKKIAAEGKRAITVQ
jgi:5'-nucleotidase